MGVCDPFRFDELPDIETKIYHFAGLVYGDFDGALFAEAARHGKVAVDVQCLLRHVEADRTMAFHDWAEKKQYLPVIDYLKTDAAEAEILEAADIAQLTPFLNSLPEHLEHPLQQSGKNLSGGQKQRLCIARAILKDAPIYVFDDSFSALDFLTEANLRRSLNEKIQGKTQIVITQRITSAMNADHIFVMDRGRLVDHGVHAELLSRCKIYQEIYASQTGGDAK